MHSQQSVVLQRFTCTRLVVINQRNGPKIISGMCHNYSIINTVLDIQIQSIVRLMLGIYHIVS